MLYEYNIPSDHAPGIHWYHSHIHGESAKQVMGGLYGALLVLPTAGKLSVAGAGLETWERITLLFSHFSAETINTSDDPFKVRTYTDLLTLSSDTLKPEYTFTNSNVKDIYLTNGQFQPTLALKAQKNYILETVNAVGDHII